MNIENKSIGIEHPTYFIADIAANHDGDLERAKDLIYLAKEAGADAAKFQHFKADSIVSQYGFDAMQSQQSHQAHWKKSVVEVYESATVPNSWTEHLAETCKKAGIHFFTSPYDLSIVDDVDPYVPAYKIGSGDITWIEHIEKIASMGKPTILAAGASDFCDVQRAMKVLLKKNPAQVCLMQCNTNYTASIDNLKYINLRVLESFHLMYPDIPLGLSDHTPGHATVLGAVTLGARMIEKHFTDDIHRVGPDHLFSMDPDSWQDMVDRTRELEAALGTGNKKVEANERETVIIQRRCIRTKTSLPKGTLLSKDDLVMLRPAPLDAFQPYEAPQVIGKRLIHDLDKGQHLTPSSLCSE